MDTVGSKELKLNTTKVITTITTAAQISLSMTSSYSIQLSCDQHNTCNDAWFPNVMMPGFQAYCMKKVITSCDTCEYQSLVEFGLGWLTCDNYNKTLDHLSDFIKMYPDNPCRHIKKYIKRNMYLLDRAYHVS